MAGEFYDHTSYPSQGAAGSSSAARAEFELIEAGFNKLPTLAGNGGKLTAVNAGGTAMEAVTTTGTGNAVRAISPALQTPTGIVKGDVGLGNVDNTSDANKPVSTAQQAALDAKQAALGFTPENAAKKNAQNGYVGLIGFSFPVFTPAGDYAAVFANSLGTANRAITLPDENGLMALTSDITGGTLAGSFTTLASGLATATSTSAAAITYPQTVRNADDVGVGTGVGIKLLAHTNATTGSVVNVRDSSGNYSLRLSTFTNSSALAEGLRLKGTGGVEVLGGGAFGYGITSGGSATQTTSRATAPAAINKPSGNITLVSAAGSTTPFSFTVSNSLVEVNDRPHVIQTSGTDKYVIHVTKVSAGSFQITAWTTGGTTTEQPVFGFNLYKGAIT